MRKISIENLKPGDKLCLPLTDDSGKILLNCNVALEDKYIARIADLGYSSTYVVDKDIKETEYAGLTTDATKSDTIRHLFDSYKKIIKMAHHVNKEDQSKLIQGLSAREFKKEFMKSGFVLKTNKLANTLVDEVMSNRLLDGISTLKTPTNYLPNHAFDVAVTSVILGRAAKLNVKQMVELALGSLVFNIGKIFLSEEILLKSTELVENEFERVRQYPAIGYEMLKEVFPILSTHIALQHREEQAGRGYPRRVKGTNSIRKASNDGTIPLFAEIVSIASAYDAMNSDRPFRKAIPHDKIWNHFQEKASIVYNQELVDKFLNILPKYPLGSNVMVTSGKFSAYTGTVVKVKSDYLNLPYFRLLYDPDGKRIEPINIASSKHPELKFKSIIT